MTATPIRLAGPDDVNGIEALLTSCRLPLDGLRDALPHILVAHDDQDSAAILGTAGIEIYKSGVLLRSVAVSENARGRGIGEALVEEAFVLARSKGAGAAYLLTTTAAGYFRRFGFERVAREDLPDDVKQSIEFTTACPSSAVAMRAALRDHIW